MSHWEDFLSLPPGSSSAEAVGFRVLRRRGREWLVLPKNPTLAARALALYPAQRRLARAARGALGFALRLRFPLEKRSINISADTPFVKFLGACAGIPSGMPNVAMLAGNPRAAGARHTFLVFDAAGRRRAVVKAGIGEAARSLIRKEADFLHQYAGRFAGLPACLGRLESDSISAFATEFIEGKSPSPRPPATIASLLLQWVDKNNEIPIAKIPAWGRLERAASGDPILSGLRKALASRMVRPVMWHGDFAPWNIKVIPSGEWFALDFERSEPAGIPGWNWLHYLVQSGILIERKNTASMARRLEELFGSSLFQHFARTTGIAGIEREIAIAYLLYAIRILRPTEGTADIKALLNALE